MVNYMKCPRCLETGFVQYGRRDDGTSCRFGECGNCNIRWMIPDVEEVNFEKEALARLKREEAMDDHAYGHTSWYKKLRKAIKTEGVE
jgi:hypothetical protein